MYIKNKGVAFVAQKYLARINMSDKTIVDAKEIRERE